MTDQITAPPPFSPRGNRILALLPTERPYAFDRLPFEEQEWRARVFLIQYTITGGRSAYAWWQALRSDGETEALRQFVTEAVTDEEIISGLLGMQVAKGTEEQQAKGGPA